MDDVTVVVGTVVVVGVDWVVVVVVVINNDCFCFGGI